jgi:hypothetical protein
MLSDIERQLLRHYAQRRPIIKGKRTAQHQRLLALGYIREQRVHPNTPDRLIIVTPAGHAALEDGPGAA